MATAIHGRGGSVTWSSLTHLDTRVNSWTLDITADTGETTAFTLTSPYARTYIPGLTSWSGSYEARLDSDDRPAHSDIGTTDPELKLYTGATYYKGSAILTGWSPSVPVDGVATATVSFQGTGNLVISDA